MKGIFSILAFVVIAGVLLFSIFGIPFLALWLLLLYLGSEKRREECSSKIAATLMSGESVIAQAVQLRPFALFGRRTFFAITSSRVISIKRGLFGGFTMQDIQWKDLRDVQLEENVLHELCGSNLVFKHSNATLPTIEINGVQSETASAMYAKAQFEEQAWEEKRRVRAMEEQRARSGGVIVNNGSATEVSETHTSSNNRMLADIEKAKQLLDMGAISDAEFQEMKAKILGKA